MQIGIMNNPSKSIYDEAENCGRAGFDFLDLTIEGPHASIVDIPKLKAILDSCDLAVTGHTDPCLPYAYPIQGVRDACFRELERCAQIFSALEAKVMNIHPCYFCPPSMKGDLLRFNIEALVPLAEMVASYGLTLVFENFKAPFDRVATFKNVLAAVPGLKLHLDFGHTNFGFDGYEVFCKELGEHIEHVHFSDNRSRTDDHMPLGVGTVNWQKAVHLLRATGFDATITLEIFCNNSEMQKEYLAVSRRLILDLWK
jgi:sugar phosphate isomerase/epimerase